MTKRIAILATGDEITNGDILNTNGQRIAHELFSRELTPGMHLSCNDEETNQIQAMNFLLTHHDYLIITGGLGPTSDDRTRFAVAKVVDKPLIQFDAAWQHIKQRLGELNISFNKANEQQCLFPKGAELLPNPNGTAMGCKISVGDKTLFMLPGPPHECLPMFINHCLPSLKAIASQHKTLLRWRIFGLPEGHISAQLDNALAHLPCQTSYRWEYPYIEFKVSTDKTIEPEIKAIVEHHIAKHIISPADISASEALAQFLKSNELDVTILDQATGGLLQAAIQQPTLKKRLHFSPTEGSPTVFIIKGLHNYWQQQPLGTTELIIEFQNQGQVTIESHQIPYRNNSVPHYAVEFCAHRIEQLLRQT